MIGLVGAAMVAFFGIVIGQLQQSPMSILYSDIEPSDGATIIQRLEAEGVQYTASAGGRIISVPRDQVNRMRLMLAGEGLSGNIVGMEIFDREGGFGRTSFELNVNYVRAVEGELARTIQFMQSVSDARVHIVMPERRPFQREASEPTASIIIKSRGGVTPRQARAIQSLAASAVPGLAPDRVTISDTTGRLLSDGRSDSNLATFSNLEEARIAKENMYRDKIQNLLGSRVGMGNVRAEVSLQMNMSRTTTSETAYDPDTQVILSQTTLEQSDRTTEPAGQVSIGNGLPDQGGAGAGASGGSSGNKNQETINYENSKTETVTIREPGEVTQIRVAVLVDGIRTLDEDGNTTAYQDRDATEIEALQQLILTAIPYDEDRGDEVTVQAMRFADPISIDDGLEVFNLFGFSEASLFRLLQLSGLILVSIIVLLTVVRPLINRIIDAIPEAPPPPTQAQLEAAAAAETQAIAGPDGYSVTPDIVAAAAAGDEEAAAVVMAARERGDLPVGDMRIDSRIDVAQVEGRIQESALKKVADIIQTNPDDSTAIIRSWLYAD